MTYAKFSCQCSNCSVATSSSTVSAACSGIALSNFRYLICGRQFSHVVGDARSAGCRRWCCSPLCAHVGQIFGLRPEKQMIQPTTWRVVARMAHVQFRKWIKSRILVWIVGQDVNDAVSKLGSEYPNRRLPIAFSEPRPGPFVATGIRLVHQCHDALSRGFVRVRILTSPRAVSPSAPRQFRRFDVERFAAAIADGVRFHRWARVDAGRHQSMTSRCAGLTHVASPQVWRRRRPRSSGRDGIPTVSEWVYAKQSGCIHTEPSSSGLTSKAKDGRTGKLQMVQWRLTECRARRLDFLRIGDSSFGARLPDVPASREPLVIAPIVPQNGDG